MQKKQIQNWGNSSNNRNNIPFFIGQVLSSVNYKLKAHKYVKLPVNQNNRTMDAIHKIEHWADTHHPKWIDFIRVVLGLFILYKGILFISNTGALMNLIREADIGFFHMALAHYVAFAHLVGGLLIAIGLLTRLAVVIQIPILLMAVFW